MSRGSSSITVTIYHPDSDYQGDDSEVDVRIEYDWYYDPGVHTMSNGDPGWPPSSGADITDWEVLNMEKPDWLTEDMVHDAFDSADLGDGNNDHYDYDYDYDDEDRY